MTVWSFIRVVAMSGFRLGCADDVNNPTNSFLSVKEEKWVASSFDEMANFLYTNCACLPGRRQRDITTLQQRDITHKGQSMELHRDITITRNGTN